MVVKMGWSAAQGVSQSRARAWIALHGEIAAGIPSMLNHRVEGVSMQVERTLLDQLLEAPDGPDSAAIDNQLDAILEQEFGQIDDLVESGEPEAAFERLTVMVATLNAASTKRLRIVRWLHKANGRLITGLRTIASAVGASEHSVTIKPGLPLSIEVSLTWK